MTAAAVQSDPRRRAMIAKVKIAQKELGLDDGTYRAVLVRLTGRDSAADCTEAQLARVLDEFKAKGWTPKLVANNRKAGRAPQVRAADHAVAKKARALWISLHQLGAVRDPSEPALEAFARRQLRVEKLQWADQGQGFRLIEALKAMAERHGWSQNTSTFGEGEVLGLKANLALAQQVKLGLARFSSAELCGLSETDLDAVIRAYARQLADRAA